MHVVLISLLSVYIVNSQVPTASDDICKLSLKIGKPVKESNSTSTIKYYFDSDLNMCFKYRTEGGDDGQNSFDTEATCRYRCIPMDFFTCGGNAPSTGACSQFDPTAPKCPSGSFCKNGGMSSMCCQKDIDDAFQKEYNPSCATGTTLVTEKVWFGEDAIRGRSCDHKFCPEGSQCHQGKWISYCCRK